MTPKTFVNVILSNKNVSLYLCHNIKWRKMSFYSLLNIYFHLDITQKAEINLRKFKVRIDVKFSFANTIKTS